MRYPSHFAVLDFFYIPFLFGVDLTMEDIYGKINCVWVKKNERRKIMKKQAFISTDNLNGILKFAVSLKENGYEIIAASSTSEFLIENGLDVSVITDDGLLGKIQKAVLVSRSNPEDINFLLENGIEPVDIVVVNLSNPIEYSSENDVYSVMSRIDFSSASILRGAIKNYKDVVALTDDKDYETVINEIEANGEVSRATKLNLCHKAMDYLCRFDTVLADYFRIKVSTSAYPEIYNTAYDKVQDLSDNGIQTGALYRSCLSDSSGLCDMQPLLGGKLTFNNYQDIDFAVTVIDRFRDKAATVIAKHSTVCGFAIGESAYDSFVKSSRTDQSSFSGAVIVINDHVEIKTALEIIKNPYAAVIALSFDDEALDVFSSKENLSVFTYNISGADTPERSFEVRKIRGGLIMRNVNNKIATVSESQCVTERKPEENEFDDILLAWEIAKHVPADSIIAVKDGQVVGIASAQTNRLIACEIALRTAGNKAEKCIIASDGPINSEDIINMCCDSKVSVIIQPGGSNKDETLINLCNEKGISMLVTNLNLTE